MTDLAQLHAQALHDARRQLTDLQVEYDRLRDAILYAQTMGLPGHVSAYLADALSSKRPGDDNPRPRTLGAALAACEPSKAALREALAELRECRDLLDAVRTLVAASVAMNANRGDGDVGPFLEAMNAHEAATVALPAEVRAWATGQEAAADA